LHALVGTPTGEAGIPYGWVSGWTAGVAELCAVAPITFVLTSLLVLFCSILMFPLVVQPVILFVFLLLLILLVSLLSSS
jgi:hypothetical protein